MIEEKQDIELKIRQTLDFLEKIKLQIQLAHKIQFSDPELSFSTAKEAWQSARSISNADLEIKALISICSSFIFSESYQEYDKWINLLEQRGKELNRNYALGRANLFRYGIRNHFGKQKEAENHLHRALEYFEADNNDQGKATCYISLGNIKFNQENYDRAYEYYQKALNVIPEESRDIMFTLRQNIASVYVMRHEYFKAWEAYQNLLDLIPEHDYGNRSLVLINLGYLSRKAGELPVAIQYYKEVIKLTGHNPGEAVYIKANCMIAEILIEMGHPEEGYKILKAVETRAGEIQNPYLLEELYDSYIKYYKAKNNLPEMEKYQAELQKVKNRIIKRLGQIDDSAKNQ